jgi:Flp pilus assembly protein TadG
MWRMSSLLAQRERGATAVVTGLLMVGLVGFTGLAVDGGATYAKHQELQNGADAAALAAAQECAEDDNCTDASLVGDVGQYGVDNVRNEKDTVSTSFVVDHDAQEVTATVTGRQTHSFVSVLGISDSELSPNATATWGSPSSGPAMLPLTISECEFANALGEPILNTVLDIYLPKGGQDKAECGWGSNYPPGGFGWLTKDGCEVPVRVDELVDGDTGVDPPRNCDWASFIDQIVLVPIFDDYQGTGENGQYEIAKFAALEVLGIRPSPGASSQVGQKCTTDPEPKQNYHNSCIRGRFIEYRTTADGYEPGELDDGGVIIIKLIK